MILKVLIKERKANVKNKIKMTLKVLIKEQKDILKNLYF
jgi:hypothetical protein